ncbi:MAG: hypothetical protein RMK75_05465 [Aquificaceae bacterium]|nr:hypothetical protein [Aquificaceae bacterium]MDW8423755.1 hypothetical protein [Aquificaceae bacterium]
MEFYFFPDVYADRYLVDTYIVSFKLRDKSCVKTREWESREYITEVLDWEAFKESAYDIALYEYGDEVARFSDIETALSEAYKMACLEASKRLPKVIEPAMGVGNPPKEVLDRVFPLSYRLENFPEDINAYLDNLIKNLEVETLEWEKADDDEIPF